MVIFKKEGGKVRAESHSKHTFFLKLIFTIAIFLMMTATVSALEWDNKASYDPITRTYTITNLFGLGKKIADVQLSSPLTVKVGAGYRMVAEFYLRNYDITYGNAFQEMNFYDKKNNNAKINREFDYRYLMDYQEWEDIKEKVCEFQGANNTWTCRLETVGTHLVKKQKWEMFSDINELPNQSSVQVGVFTNVEVGDNVEWIPKLFGVKLTEWAAWTSDLNVSLLSYYKFDGDLVDVLGAEDLTNEGTINASGILNSSRDYDGTNDRANRSIGSFPVGNDARSVALWFKLDDISASANENPLFYYGAFAAAELFQIDIDFSNLTRFWGHSRDISGTTVIALHTWYFLVVTHDGTTTRLYVNGLNEANATQTLNSASTDISFGNTNILGGGWINGQIDETGLWTRALNSSEVTLLYNNGDGLSIGYDNPTPDYDPSITLNSPTSDANYTTPQSILFNYTASDDINLSDVKLYVNDALNATNASGLNNTDYLWTLGFNDGDYTIYGLATDNSSQEANTSLIRIVIDTTPFIEFLTPPTLVNDSNITTNLIPMNVNVSTPYFQNITYSLENINGTIYSYFSSSGVYYYNFTEVPDGNYNYNVSICTTTLQCNSTGTRYISVDANVPIISIETPTSVMGYNVVGGNETLNFTATDINLDTCWYNYNGTNITIEGCATGAENSTIFTLIEDNYNLTVYANDTFGNKNSNFIGWSYNLTLVSQTYPATSIESSTETYTANLSYNSSKINIISGSLKLNGSSYAGTRTGSGDAAIFTTTATMPSLEVETNFTAYWTISLTDEAGTIDYNLTSTNVTVSIINFTLCDATNNIPFWNFTILNESNEVEINSTFEATFYVGATGSSAINTFSYSDTTLNTSQYDFCISPSTASYTIDTNIKLTKTGYVDKFYNFNSVIVTNATREDNLYMMASEDSTSFIVHTVYISGKDLVGATVKVLRYYPGTDEWLTTEILTTNDDGEAIGHFLSEDADYKFQVSVDGINIYNSSSTKIVCAVAPCTVTLIIPTSLLTGYETYENLTTTLTYDSNTNTFTYTYEDTSGIFTAARLLVTRISPSNATLVFPCNETKTTASGVITCDITGQVNGTYSGVGYITREDEFVTKIIYGNYGAEIYDFIGDDGILWGFFIIIGVAMLGISRPSLAIIFSVISLIFVSLLGLINIGVVAIVAVSSIGIILLMRVGRE